MGRSNGKRPHGGEWGEEKTKPNIDPPPSVLETSGEVPEIDDAHRKADSIDNLALSLKEVCTGLHEIAMDIRHTSAGGAIPDRHWAAIGGALRHLADDVTDTADTVHPQGRRAAGGGG